LGIGVVPQIQQGAKRRIQVVAHDDVLGRIVPKPRILPQYFGRFKLLLHDMG
jgi:hypothetical protein